MEELVKHRKKSKFNLYFKQTTIYSIVLTNSDKIIFNDFLIDHFSYREAKHDEDKEEDKLNDALSSAIIQEKPNVSWDDVAGLKEAKSSL